MHPAARIAVTIAVLGLLGVGRAVAQSAQPRGWDAGVKAQEASDTNPDPRIVEISLEARVARVDIAPEQSVDA